MSFNTINQYTPSHKAWDHVGNITSPVEHSEGIRPLFPFQPAPYLPVGFYDKHYENWMVIMSGKLVTLDPLGYVIPAGLGLTGQTLSYTANDVTAGTLDIRTGSAVTSADTVTLSDVDGSTYSILGKSGWSFNDSAKKYPIGVAPQPFLQWAGDGSSNDTGFNPVAYRKHNYNMQHQVPVLCDYVLKLPYVPAQSASESISQVWNNSAITFGTDNGWRNRTYIQATARYNSSTGEHPCLDSYNVAALPLEYYPVAKNTNQTTLTTSHSTLLTNEVDGLSGIIASGDYWVDYDFGVLFVYSASGSTLPVSGAETITYYHYAANPSTVSAFGSVVASATELKPGDFLKCDSDSNFVRLDPTADDAWETVGQVLGFSAFPQDYLDRVRTAYNPALNTSATGTMANATAGSGSVNVGQLDRMTGSATQGIPSQIVHAGGANKLVIVNLINR